MSSPSANRFWQPRRFCSSPQSLHQRCRNSYWRAEFELVDEDRKNNDSSRNLHLAQSEILSNFTNSHSYCNQPSQLERDFEPEKRRSQSV